MSTKDFSRVQEKMVADYLGSDWNVVSGSGAAPCVPGDVVGPDWLLECKTHVTRQAQITFRSDHWHKIKEEAAVKHRLPALITDNGTQQSQHTWVMIKESHVPDASCLYIIEPKLRSTTNITIKTSELTEYVAKASVESGHTKSLSLRVTIDNDKCLIMKLSTFQEQVGD